MNYLKISVSISAFLLLTSLVKAQNLLANPDFVDVNTCTEQNAPCAPEAWLLASPRVPVHKDDYVLVTVHNSGKRNVRQYLQTQLLQELKAGHEYEFTIRFKAGKCVINSIGVKFSDQFTCLKKDELIEQPDIDFSTEIKGVRTRKQREWMEFTTTYVARGGEKFILIGCFDSFREQERDFKKKPEPYNNFYYYFDRVELIDPNLDSLPESAHRVRDHLYAYNHRHSFCNYMPYEESEEIHLRKNPKDSIGEKSIDHQPDTIVLGDILFDFNSSKLKEDAAKEINEKTGQVDISSIKSIKITGYTDNIGSEDYNKNLSKERAESVKGFLVSLGIEQKLISANGAGSKKPVATNETEAGRARNRRIEIYLEYK